MSKEASGDSQAIFEAWIFCANCKQNFQGALDLEMARRSWRRNRSSEARGLPYNSTRYLAGCLGENREFDAANQLVDDLSKCVVTKEGLLQLKYLRADLQIRNDQKLEGLGLLRAMLPEAAKARHVNPMLYIQVRMLLSTVFCHLGRYQDAHEAVAELVAFAKAKFGLEHRSTLAVVKTYAHACAKLGRVKEAKADFEDVLTTEARVFGREHPDTQTTRHVMRSYGLAVPF